MIERSPTIQPQLTVCVCTHGRPAYVTDCLAGLAQQACDPDLFEIVVVDSNSPSPAAETLAAIVGGHARVRLIVLDQPGVSLARNTGARSARAPYIAFIDDDAIPAPDWVAAILRSIQEASPPPALIGGRILPLWEAALPAWWPSSLRNILSIIEYEGRGTYRSPSLPATLEPYAANMVVAVGAIAAAGGFSGAVGRYGSALLSDEEVQLAWKLQDAGHSVIYDSRITVHHQIQATRLNPRWLLNRLYWQGASTVITRRMLGRSVWREAARRAIVMVLFMPVALIPKDSVRLLALRWRFAYASGFIRAIWGWRAASSARRLSTTQAA